ncbi:hypothetical protein MPLA_170002 [Mesorhizobium sp. ORS 3359]|nr:hypothetical protein MPLA_170002 [Mesorhizobium sp. ORS 3359]
MGKLWITPYLGVNKPGNFLHL